MSRRRAYSDPTADQALRNIAEQAMREYEERHRKKSPDVIRYEELPAETLVKYITERITERSEVINMTNVAVYPVSRTYTHQVTPSIKSLMMNSEQISALPSFATGVTLTVTDRSAAPYSATPSPFRS